MTDYERGFRAGIEAAARYVESDPSQPLMVGGVCWEMARGIRALSPKEEGK